MLSVCVVRLNAYLAALRVRAFSSVCISTRLMLSKFGCSSVISIWKRTLNFFAAGYDCIMKCLNCGDVVNASRRA